MRKSRPNAVQFSGTLVSKSKRNMDQRRFSSSRIIESRQVIVGPALVKVELRKVDGEPEIFTVNAMVLSVSQEQPQASSSNPIASEVCTPNLAGIRNKYVSGSNNGISNLHCNLLCLKQLFAFQGDQSSLRSSRQSQGEATRIGTSKTTWAWTSSKVSKGYHHELSLLSPNLQPNTHEQTHADSPRPF